MNRIPQPNKKNKIIKKYLYRKTKKKKKLLKAN